MDPFAPVGAGEVTDSLRAFMRRCRLPSLALLVALASAGMLAPVAGAAVPAWTTYRHDAARTGIDPDRTIPVRPAQAWQTHELDGEVYAQPLVYGSSVFVATENDTVYRLDAATGRIVWSRHLGTPEPSSAAPCGDISPSIGITSTPVVDPAADRIYAVGAVSAGGEVHHELFAFDLGSGHPIGGFPIRVDPRYPSGGAAVNQLQRAGLALDAGRILIGYGGNDGDCNTYWGWLVSAPTNGTAALTAFQADADYTEGAIWAGGNAPPVNAGGDLFVSTGNGSGDATSDPEYGDSVVKLNASASPLDWWAPPDWQSLDSSDADLGSGMPTLLPGGFVFQSGKDGNGYLLNGGSLGHVGAPAGEVSGFCSGGSYGGSIYDPANSTIYAACSDGLQALSLGSGSPPSLSEKTGFAPRSSASGPPTIAAGRVWVTDYGSGSLDGLDPSSGATKSHFPIPENGSDVNHFASPSAGDGRLFVASGDQVTAFTIAEPSPVASTATTLTASLNPAPAGTAVSVTAAVSPAPDAGSITVTDGGAPVAGCVGVATSVARAGRAVCHVAFARVGAHRLVATYSGDPFYAPSRSAGLVESVTSGGSSTTPVIYRPAISPRRFPASTATTLRLTLSEAATVNVTITQGRRGHLVGARCSTRSRRGRSCLVQIRLARRLFHARSGRNAFTLRLGRLAPGRYAATVVATNPAGRRSRTVQLAFTIIRA